MKVLVIGQGGREHAIARALRLSSSITEVHAAPGSEAMAVDALCHPLNFGDRKMLEDLLRRYGIDLVVIGPEVPLAEGLADAIRALGVDVFGPSQAAARLEASKIFAKEFMNRAQVPTARYFTVQSVEETLKAAENFKPPYVLKADGLAAGKGVVLAQNLEELRLAASRFFEEQVFGVAGSKAILEEYQSGWELSYLILTDGQNFEPFPLAQDHKRLRDQDQGPNTGGMGVVAPLKIDPTLDQTIRETILKPSVEQLAQENLLFRGVLFVGIMVTPEGPQTLEYNVRLGDPEAQVLLPLLEGDWGEVFASVAQGRLPTLRWKKLFSACVVLAAEGYPENPIKGSIIEGNPLYETPSSYFLHAGTQKNANGYWTTAGGRVLNAVAIGSSLAEAIKNAYHQARAASWVNQQMREDIGWQQK